MARGIRQVVRAHTRNEYLLDLVITDLANVSVHVLPGVADHNIARVAMQCEHFDSVSSSRTVWLRHKADWQGLKHSLNSISWHDVLNCHANEAAIMFSDTVMGLAKKFIPQTTVHVDSQRHPWITQACRGPLLLNICPPVRPILLLHAMPARRCFVQHIGITSSPLVLLCLNCPARPGSGGNYAMFCWRRRWLTKASLF